MTLPRVVIAGTASGVGKTTVATGLMAALTARGRRVAGYKVGPDFIDPSYHAVATQRPPRNLDAFLSGTELIAPLFAHGAAGADVAVVEGVMGLYDGASGRGEMASTAQVAKLLDAPVILVVDASGMARSVAAMVLGYATFDPAVRIAGVIANRVGSDRHTALLRDALAALDIPLLGALRRDETLLTPSRHLGLVPAPERAAEATVTVAALGERVAAAVELDAVERLAGSAPPLQIDAWAPGTGRGSVPVAVAMGRAFTFAYTENLELLAGAGADILPFDPTADEQLPPGARAVYLGGGFPEVHAEALAANVNLRRDVAALARTGAPIIGECGGLLYLCRSLDGHEMCGVLPLDAQMTGRLTLGYREATAARDSVAWQRGDAVRAHEFHRTAVRRKDRDAAAAAWRWDGTSEGFVRGSVHASYLHSHWAATPQVARRFVEAAA